MNTWYWLRVYYFENHKDDLIIEAVWPMIERMASRSNGCCGFFRRDWTGGPHVLIGLRPEPRNDFELHLCRDPLDRYLERNPSKTILSVPDYHEQFRTAAHWSVRGTEAEFPLQPNNSILLDCTEPDLRLVPDGPLREAIRNALCQSSRLVAAWLSLVNDGAYSRHHIACSLLIALAWLACPEHLRTWISFRSHANGFLRFADPTGRLGAVLEARYGGRDGMAARQLLTSTIAALQQHTHSLPHMEEYLKWLAATMTDLAAGLSEGRYRAMPVRDWEAAMKFGSESLDPEVHRKLFRLLDHSPYLRSWQMTVNIVYLVLNQLGISGMERFMACYWLAKAAEEVFGEGVEQIARPVAMTGNTTTLLPFFARLSAAAVTRGLS